MKKIIFFFIVLVSILLCISGCAHKHIYGEWTVDKEATCSANGIEKRVCECGELETREIVFVGSHSFGEWTETLAPTCSEKGLETRICVCGESETREINATGEHTFGEWTEALAATCVDNGSKVRECACGATETAEIEFTGIHTFGEWSLSDESVCPATQKDVRTCINCPETETRVSETQGEHAYGEKEVYRDATCTKHGELRAYCACGEYISEKVKAGHKNVIDAAVFPTDTKTGLTEGSHCSVCGTVKVKQKVVGKLSRQNVDMFTWLGYEGNMQGEITLKWTLNEEASENIFGFIVQVTLGDTTKKYEVMASEGDWTFNMPQKSGKYTFKVYPVDKTGIKANSKSVTVNWYPELLEYDFPRIEITTLNGELPTFTKVSAPAGCWGTGLQDANYVQSLVSLYDGGDNLLYCSSETDFNAAKIKVRGNTSAQGDKQPFKIKLSRKADLLAGLVERKEGVDYREKDWVLLTYGNIYSYVAGYAVADLVGCDWTPEYTYVTLFVNGDYRGLYVLIESVEQGPGRCDVADSGYIVEMDAYWWNEDLYFTTPISEKNPAKLTFKYPDSDDIDETSPQYAYIKEYMTKMENALLSGEGAEDFLDYESAMKWLLTHDILATYDSGGSNMFMTKYDSTDDSKIVIGPNWDFGTVYSREPERFARIREGSFFYMYWLIKDDNFMTMYKERYSQIRDEIIDTVTKAIQEYDTDVYKELLNYETTRWGGSRPRNPQNEIDKTTEWLESHLAWMDEQLK